MEMELQLLEADEVPWRLDRVGAHAGVRRRAQRGIDEDRQHEDEGDQCEPGCELAQQKIGEGRNPLGFLVADLLGRSRIHHPAHLAHPPEVEAHQEHQRDRDQGGVEGVEDHQCCTADLGTAARHPLQPPPDPGDIAEHADADGHRPVGELVPRQQVAGEVGRENKGQQRQADHPVEAARAVPAAGEEDPQHVGEDHRDQDVGAPVVDIAHQTAEEIRAFEPGHGLVGQIRRGLVDQNHQQSGGKHQADQNQ